MYYHNFTHFNSKRIFFSNIAIGEKFKKDFFARGKARNDVVCIKTSSHTYKEVFSGAEHKIVTDQFEVTTYN